VVVFLDSIILWVWLGVAVLTLVAWCLLPGLRGWVLPPQRHRVVPWTAFEVLAALCLGVIPFWALVLNGFLTPLGFWQRLYGPDFVSEVHADSGSAHELAQVRAELWLQDLSFPLTALSIVAVLHVVSGTRPYQLGLTMVRVGRNVVAGLLAWVCLTPFTYLVFALAIWLTALLGVKEIRHPLEMLGRTRLSGGEWALILVSAVVAAPAIEELVFRGVVQPWLARRSWGGFVGVVAALLLAIAFHQEGLKKTFDERHAIGFVRELIPYFFVLALVPGFLLLWKWVRSPAPLAICGTSLVWAMLHANVWPTPVPLFVLGLGLGYLAYRTQSLVAPVVLHALFNGVACAMLLAPQPAPPPVPPPENGSPATSAARGPAGVSTSTETPGSWLPRRRYASAIDPNRGDTTEDVTSPTSSLPRSTRAPDGTAPSPETFRPSSVRLTWPRSRAMTIGSWPR
jgi:membrane protease YdiL (CAAX protease family)